MDSDGFALPRSKRPRPTEDAGAPLPPSSGAPAAPRPYRAREADTPSHPGGVSLPTLGAQALRGAPPGLHLASTAAHPAPAPAAAPPEPRDRSVSVPRAVLAAR